MRSLLASLPWSLNLALRRCRNDYDRSLSAGKDSETTHALGLRSHPRRVLDVEIVRNRSRILLLVFARSVGRCSSRKVAECLEASNIRLGRSDRAGYPSSPPSAVAPVFLSSRSGPRPAASTPAGAPGRASGGQRHGLHHSAAPRPKPRQHDGGFAGGPYVNASPAGARRHENRTRARLCYSAWRLSLGQ